MVQYYMSNNLERIPQGQYTFDGPWICDMASMFVQKQYQSRAKANDWLGFVADAKTRLSITPCPGMAPSAVDGKRSWFIPLDRTAKLVLCQSCYYDHAMWSNEAARWRQASDWKLILSCAGKVYCAGAQFNTKICMARSYQLDDLGIFWRAIDKLGGASPLCVNSTPTQEWYTVRAISCDFSVCKPCYTTILEPMKIGHMFKRMQSMPQSQKRCCCLSPEHLRVEQFLPKLAELCATLDEAAFSSYVSLWTNIPPCCFDSEKMNWEWYGWEGCKMCRECFLEFATKFPSMMKAMEFQGKKIAGGTICDMYSPRMRKLFRSCAESSDPPNTHELMQYASQRREVYLQTMPQCRDIVHRMKINLANQQIMNSQSTAYAAAGMGYTDQYIWSASDVGGGFQNIDLLRSAQYSNRAMKTIGNAREAAAVVGQLEQLWRSVE